MTTWATTRNQIRQGLLKDVDGAKYLDAEMLIWAQLACLELSMTWAQRASVALVPDGTKTAFAAPGDLVGSLDRNVLLAYTDSSATASIVRYKRPIGQLQRYSASEIRTFCEAPIGTIQLSWAPKATETLTLEYFKTWDAPTGDSFVMPFPKIIELPYVYLVAAYAMHPAGTQASDLGQWDTKIDSGDPEHNPLHKQFEFFIRQAYKLLGLIGGQDRELLNNE